MSVERIDIQISSTGAPVVVRDLEAIAASAQRSASSLKTMSNAVIQLKTALGGITLGLLVRELAQYVDSWIMYENNIKLSTKSTEEAATVQRKLFEAAQNSRMEMTTAITLYRRTAQAARELGASQDDMIKFTEGVGKALVIQGLAAKTAHGALLQLGQLLGMARIRAQEFNSINENAPRILQAVADNIGIAEGSIHKLRMALNKGLISNKEFFDAFMRALPKLNQEFGVTTPTIEQGFIVLSNAVGRYINDLNKAVQGSTKFTGILIWMAKNVDILAKSVAVLGLTLGAAFGPWLYTQLMRAAVAIQGLLVSIGPIGWAFMAITAASSALLLFKDDIVILEQNHVTLGDYFTAVWGGLKSKIRDAATELKPLIEKISDARTAMNDARMTSWSYILIAAISFIKSQINEMIRQFVLLGGVIVAVGSAIPRAFSKGPVEGFVGFIKDLQELGKNNPVGTDYIDDIIKRLNAAATAAALARQKAQQDADTSTRPGPGISREDDISKLQVKLRHLLDSVDPIGAAYRKVADAQELLTQAMKAGLITATENNKIMGMVEEHYKAAVDPYGEYIRKLQEEIQYMKMNHDERTGNLQAMEAEQDLKRKGYKVSEEELAQIRALTIEKNELKRISDEMERIDRKYYEAQRKLVQGQDVLNKMLREGRIGASQYRQELAELRLEAGKGTWTDGFIKAINLLDDRMANFTARTGEAFARLTEGLVDGFSVAVARSIVYAEDLKTALGDISRAILTELIASLIKLGIQYVLNAALSASAGTSAMSAITAASVTEAGITATAWAPAAAAVSLASYGANSVPAMTGISSTYGLAAALSIPGMWFEEGGYTGNKGRKQIAGFVHGQEYVINAGATARNRPLLEAINKGATPSFSSQGNHIQMNVSVHNETPANITVERLSPTDIRIIARNEAVKAVHTSAPSVVANELANPNSRVSKSLSQNTNAQRRR